MKCSVYILFSSNYHRFYIGISENIERRLAEHNRGKVKSTKAFIPWTLVHREFFSTRREARVREKYLKSAAGRKWRKQNVKF